MTNYDIGEKKIDKEFEWEGRDFWYQATVEYNTSFTPAVMWGDNACPEESDLQIEHIEIDDLVEFDQYGREININLLTAPKALLDAIEEDAIAQMEE